MSHNHSHHHHSHAINPLEVNNAFMVGIALNFAFVVVEVVAGLYVHSLSLLSDAGHNLADVASLALSLFAMKLAKVKPNSKYTYGYKKTTVLVALFNAMVLLVSIGAIGYEAMHRFLNPEPISGETISIVAAVGIGINAFTAFLFLKDKEKDLNVKSAFLHLLSDALVSAGLVVGGIIMIYTNYYWIDPVLSIIVAIVILASTWSLLQDSLKLSMDGVPTGIDLESIKSSIRHIAGVKDFHHIHIWAISTTENALTGHLIVNQSVTFEQVDLLKKEVKHELEHANIQHVTLEIETENEECKDRHCE